MKREKSDELSLDEEAILMMVEARMDVTALIALLVKKGVFTMAELNEALGPLHSIRGPTATPAPARPKDRSGRGK
jgi:hypothetical protein